MADLKTNEKTKSQEEAKLVEEFKHGEFTYSLDGFFLNSPAEETAVVPRIEKLEHDIKSKESEAVVRGLGLPLLLAVPSFDLTAARTLAATKLAAVHEAAEKRVLAQIARNFKDTAQARQFIRQGLDLIQEDCPFCGQDLKEVTDLLKAYRDFFDEEFRAYQESVRIRSRHNVRQL